MTKRISAATFRASDLRLVAPAPPADCPPLRFGEWCTLNSGSSPLLVVDVEADAVVVAFPSGEERKMPRACVRRIA